MKRLTAIAVIVAAASLIACSANEEGKTNAPGSPSGSGASAAEVAAARAKLSGKPTGRLDASNASKVASGLREDTAGGDTAAAFGPSGGGGGGDVGTRSIQLAPKTIRLLTETSSLDACADYEARKDVGTCKCDEGQLRYEIPNLAALESDTPPPEADVRLQFEKCKMNGKVGDGTLAIQLGATSKESGTRDMLYVVNMTIDADKIAVAFAMKNGEIWYSQDVDAAGKYVLVKLDAYSSGEGTYTVQAENGEFDCSIDDGEGECKNAATGDTLAVKDEGAPATSSGGDPEPAPEDPKEEEPLPEDF